MRSTNASSGRGSGTIVIDPDQNDFSGNAEVLQLAASIELNSNRHLNRIDETRSNNTVEACELSVRVKKFCQATTSHQ